MTYSYRNHPAHLVCLSVYLYSHKPVFILSWVFPFSLSIHLYISLSFFFLSFHIPCTNFFDFFKNYFMMSDGGGEGEGGGGILFLFLAPSLPFSLSLIASISVFIPPLVLYDLACRILPSLHVLFVFSLLSPLPTLSFCP